MKCTILHDLPGRLRVHLCCGRMTLSQADVLEYYLRAQDGVQIVFQHIRLGYCHPPAAQVYPQPSGRFM